MSSLDSDINIFRTVLPDGEDDLDLADLDEVLAETQEDSVAEDEIDLQALADEVYALMKKELKLELQRLGRLGH